MPLHFWAVLLFGSCLVGLDFLCLWFGFVFFSSAVIYTQPTLLWAVTFKTQRENDDFPFFLQGIATSLGILADIFASMNEKDYVRFKSNAEIDLVRFDLMSVHVDILQVNYMLLSHIHPHFVLPPLPLLCWEGWRNFHCSWWKMSLAPRWKNALLQGKKKH